MRLKRRVHGGVRGLGLFSPSCSLILNFDKHPELGSKWDRSFWARGYYAATVGNVNEKTVKEYIRRQTEESMNEEKKTYRPH